MDQFAIGCDERMVGFRPQDIDRAASLVAVRGRGAEQRTGARVGATPPRLILVQYPLMRRINIRLSVPLSKMTHNRASVRP